MWRRLLVIVMVTMVLAALVLSASGRRRLPAPAGSADPPPNPLSTRSAGPRYAAGTRSCPIETLAWSRPHDVHVGLANPTIPNFP